MGVLWTLTALLRPSKEKQRAMLYTGLFLAIGDWVFETSGYLLNYWNAHNSLFPIGPAVPIEVFGIALCAGAALNLLWPKKADWRLIVPSSFLIACAGTVIEAGLVSVGNLVYLSGWTSYHAFVWYFIAFAVFQFANNEINKTRSEPASRRKQR